MAQAGINAILFGAVLVLLGMMPNLIAALIQALHNFRNQFFWPRGHIYNTGSDVRVSGNIGLIVGGAALMIAGFVSLLWSAASS